MRKELDAALARATERAETEQRDAANEEAKVARVHDEDNRRLFAPAKELAAELARRAQEMDVPMDCLIRFSAFRKRRWKSGWIWHERSYWLVSVPGSSSTTIPRNLLIDGDANLYWEDGCGQQPLPVIQKLSRSEEYLPNFTVDLVAEWLAGATRRGTG